MRRLLARARGPPETGAHADEVHTSATYPSYAEVRHDTPPASFRHRDAKGDVLPALLPGLWTPKRGVSADDTRAPAVHRKSLPPFSFRRRTLPVELSAELHGRELPAPAEAPVVSTASVDDLPHYLAEFCGAEPTTADWECVHELGDLINQSPAHSKAALRALVHELKRPHTASQCRAVRAWGVWAMHSGSHFSEVAVSQALVAQLENILTNPLTYPSLRDDTLLVVGALALRSRQNYRLHKIARLWARTRPSTSPEEGVPLTGPLFQDDCGPPAARMPEPLPPELLGRPVLSPKEAPEPTQIPAPLAAPHDLPVPPSLTPSHSSYGSQALSAGWEHHSYGVSSAGPGSVSSLDAPSEWDDARVAFLEQECVAAKTNAALLTEVLINGEEDEALLSDISAKLQFAQNEIEPHLAWAAERTSSMEGDAQSRAEGLLHHMVSALSSAGEALALRDSTTAPADTMATTAGANDTLQAPSAIDAPPAPSEKALGKRRALDEPSGERPPLPPLPDL
ncbi:hypothetical protein MNAN1_000331 [Malassezia nana]|uniref:VHS domain-containing protein n=1 Tax=Malassezia nana TaxID=180528 RepID=A0AAF0EGN2_9BASI|nr:hypothetical protein MNAN1_000331 [Malassezia nana]